MKTIKNKSVNVSVPTKEGVRKVEKKYSELVIECINNPPKDGFSVQEMQQRMRILKVAEKANGEIKLEDSDFEKLRECVRNMRWVFLSEDLIEFCETIILTKNG